MAVAARPYAVQPHAAPSYLERRPNRLRACRVSGYLCRSTLAIMRYRIGMRSCSRWPADSHRPSHRARISRRPRNRLLHDIILRGPSSRAAAHGPQLEHTLTALGARSPRAHRLNIAPTQNFHFQGSRIVCAGRLSQPDTVLRKWAAWSGARSPSRFQRHGIPWPGCFVHEQGRN